MNYANILAQATAVTAAAPTALPGPYNPGADEHLVFTALLVTAAGILGALVGALAGLNPDPGGTGSANPRWAWLGSPLGGGIADWATVFWVANTNLNTLLDLMRALGLAAVCGTAWRAVIVSAQQSLHRGQENKDVQRAADAVNQPPTGDPSALRSVQANLITLAEKLPLVTDPDLRRAATGRAVDALKQLGQTAPADEAARILGAVAAHAAAHGSVGLKLTAKEQLQELVNTNGLTTPVQTEMQAALKAL